MAKITSEYTFEEHIEDVLLKSHGFFGAKQDDYDKALCLRPATVIQFIRATQTKKWADYCELIDDLDQAKRNLLKRIKDVVDKEGTLHALRKGFDIHGGGHFDLCYFEPTNPVAEESRRLYKENLLHLQRQVKFSDQDEKSLDMGIFLNGLPIFTIELKNQISGQNVTHALKQYKATRDPKEPLFRFKRCLAHFAVDNDLVYVTTELAGAKTQFLPFNQGADGGAGNPPCKVGYATSYLWQDVWQKPRILDLIQRFIRVVDVLDDKGRPTGKQRQIFPRFHQLTCVRELGADAQKHGAGRRYLNQHSAGSGKTNCIAWLANSLATLHTPDGKPVFSSVIVISDRRVIDRQLQRTLKQVIETPGMLVNIAADDGMTAKDLKTALEDGKRIIVTTLQKFGVIMDSMGELPGERFAVIVDEAHSSQGGDSAKAVEKVLSYASEDEQNDEEEKTVEDRILEELKHRGPQKNVSHFAFTATPKPETLRQFGTRQADGTYKPCSLYTMRQAIEEGFILDVLKNYATYDQYWKLLKKVKDDPRVDEVKAKTLLRQFVSRHERTIAKKVAIIVDHFQTSVSAKLGGKAKAMIVTSSRLHAVRYRLAVDAYLKSIGSPFKALVAFTDVVKDSKDGKEYTEAKMNGFPQAATADRFEADDCRFLIVASKFQTGFDQPKLMAMYVDKKLSGVACVQTLSRLNRTMAGKEETFVLDFENSAEDIEKGFQPFYDRITLSKETDPHQLYNIRTDLDKFAIHEAADVEAFAKLWFVDKPKIDKLHAAVDLVAAKWKKEAEEEQVDYKSKARDFVKLYSFISHLVPLRDVGLEKLYVFLRFLLPKLPAKKGELPLEVLGMVDMEKLAVRKNDKKDIGLKRGETKVDPLNYGGGATLTDGEYEALSKIIGDLNTRFNTSFTEDEVMVIKHLEKKIGEDEALQQQLKNGSRHAVEATFQQVAKDAFEDLVNDNFKFYKKVSEDDEVSKEFFARLFEWYVEGRSKSPPKKKG
ncbi:type I restriction endonuclease [Rhodoferax sp.]|uniref:type I restriction endonuclease subunit R n=1 Tax=Rhodoferax sp. TaxID=50421 RepID=UPI0026230D95|nr:type I restriction endonuclease [Rhodoferax sp.]MDD2919325.1 DEAD/DEAH box helicase family protein [Rhodoferax sp.]